jgi:hypothetical protein
MGRLPATPRPALRPIDELALAAELLDSWERGRLAPVMGEIVQATVGRLPESTGRRLVGTLAGVAARILPPKDVDGPLRSAQATEAGALLGLETEGLSPEGTEFELARQLVRFCAAAADATAVATRTRTPQAAVQAGTARPRDGSPQAFWPRALPQHPRGA